MPFFVNIECCSLDKALGNKKLAILTTEDFPDSYCHFSYMGNWELVKPIVGTNFKEARFVYTLKHEIGDIS